MIIVDDCSNDDSVRIAKEFERKDQRIKVYVNERNVGDYPNRNKAASYANGKYLKYLDADDMIYPHGLEIFTQTMEQFPEAALGISQEVAEDNQPYPFIMSPQETYQREFLKRGVLGMGPTGTIIRRDVFEELGGFSGTRYIGDTEMWYKIAAKYPVVKMVPGLVYWRKHQNQEFLKGTGNHSYLENSYKLAKNTLYQPDVPLTLPEVNKARHKLNKRFARDILKLAITEKEPVKAMRIARSCNFKMWEIPITAF